MSTSRGGLTFLDGTIPSRDGTPLYVCSLRPPQPLGVVAVVHGYGDHSGCYRETMERLATAGFETHAVDLRGHGHSGGRRGHVGRWHDYLDDLSAFLERVRRSTGADLTGNPRPLFLLGQSHGGLLILHAALAGLAEVQGVILTSPYVRCALPVSAWKLAFGRVASRIVPWLPLGSEIRSEMLTADPAVLETARGDPLTLRIATPGWFFAAERAQAEALARAPDFRLPVLVIQGGRDPVTDPAATELLFQRLGSEDKSFRLFPQMRHETLREAGRDAVWDTILAWLRDRLPG
jgi:lysophospholipase